MQRPNVGTPGRQGALRDLHDAIRERLHDERITDVAKRSGVPRQTLYALRDPASNPKADTLERVADALDLHVAWSP